MVCAVDVVPTDCSGKVSDPGDKLNESTGGGWLIPLTFTTAAWPENRSVTKISSYELPPSASAIVASVGAKATEIWHGVEVQELPWVKKNGTNCASPIVTVTG